MLQSIYFLTAYLLFLMSKIYKVFAHTKKNMCKAAIHKSAIISYSYC